MAENNFGKGIKITSGFDLSAKLPLDNRYIVKTLEERDAHVTNNRAYEGMKVYVLDEKKEYIYNGTEWTEQGGISDEQLEQLIIAYQHSQSKHVTIEDLHTHDNKSVLDGITSDLEKIESSEIEPTDKMVSLWINTSEEIPANVIARINDDTVTSNTTWSSEKINTSIISSSSNIDLSAYALKTELPTATSQLMNDSNFITSIPSEYVTETELTAKGYLTEHQDISGKADKTELHNHSNKSVLDGITSDKVNSWDNKSEFDGNYNNLTNKPNIPTKTSELTNDSSLATETYVINKIAEAELNDKEVDLSGYATKDELPTKTSQLTNDSNFITSIPSEYITDTELNSKNYATKDYVDNAIDKVDVTEQLIDYAKKSELHNHTNKTVLDGITSTKITEWNNKSTFSGSYNDLSNKPTIPTKTSQLTNDSNFLTEHQDISHLAEKTELHNHSNKSVLDGITASKVSSWDNKSNFDGNYNSLTNKPSIPSIEGLATENYVNDKVAGISVDIDYESELKFDTDAMIDYTIAIVGEVDENNIITLWSNVLSDGLYTLRYSNGNEYANIGTVFIGELMLTKIEATKVLTTYSEGDTLYTDDIIVKAFYNDGTSKNISDYTLDISSVKMDTPGDYQIIITYENMSINIAIRVREKATIKGNLFDSSTCTFGKRINSSGLEKDQTHTFLTDYIDIGDCMNSGSENVIHWQGFHLYSIPSAEVIQGGLEGSALGSIYRGIAYYDATGKFLGNDSSFYVEPRQYDNEGNFQYTLNSSYVTATKIRIYGVTLPPAASVSELLNCKLTLNQLISEI